MKFDSSKILEQFADKIVDAGWKVFYCLIIVIICALLVRISRRLINTFFMSSKTSARMIDKRKASTLNSIISSVVKYIFYFVAIFSVLAYLGIPIASLLTVAGVGSVAIGFGAQSLVQDVITGFFILLEDQYGVGDIVTIQGNTGTVEEITIRTTRLRSADGTVYIIPNGSVGIVTNVCKEYMNAVVDVDIDYSENMDNVLKVLNNEMDKASENIEGLKSRPNVLGIIALNESAVTVRIVAECEIKENFRIERELRLIIKARLDKENISIPFPQRTIHIVKEA